MFQSEQYRFPVCGFSQISSSTNQLQVTHNETKQEEKQRKQQRKKTSEPRGALVKSREAAAENNVLTHASTDNNFFFGSLSRSGATLRHLFFPTQVIKSQFFFSFKPPPASDKSTIRDSACVHSYSISAQKYSPRTTTKT